MIGILLALLAGFFVALSDTLNKKFFSSVGHPYMMLARTIGTILFLIPGFLYLSLTKEASYEYINLELLSITFILLSLELIATVLYMRGIQISPLSLTLPFLSFTPVFVIVTGYLLLGEKVTLLGGLGIILIVIGSYVLNLPSLKNGILGPFKAIRYEKGSLLLLQVALIYSITSVLGKMGLLMTDPLWFASFYFLLLGISGGLVTKIFFKVKIIKFIKKSYEKILWVGLTQALMCYAHMVALYFLETAYMIALKRISILFAVIMGYFVFKEGYFKIRFLAVVLMFLGIVTIVFLG